MGGIWVYRRLTILCLHQRPSPTKLGKVNYAPPGGQDPLKMAAGLWGSCREVEECERCVQADGIS